MATECRKRTVNRCKPMNFKVWLVLLILVMVAGVVGFSIGKSQAETVIETVTLTETVEVPVYEADRLPEIGRAHV